jgi:hypothetical protein
MTGSSPNERRTVRHYVVADATRRGHSGARYDERAAMTGVQHASGDEPQTKAEFVQREMEARSTWSRSVSGYSPDAQRSDGWTLKEIVAHIAAWQRYSIDRILALAEGQDDPGPPRDTNGFNESARARADSWHETWHEFLSASAQLIEYVSKLPEDRILANDGLIAFIMRVNGSEHYKEHPASDLD